MAPYSPQTNELLRAWAQGSVPSVNEAYATLSSLRAALGPRRQLVSTRTRTATKLVMLHNNLERHITEALAILPAPTLRKVGQDAASALARLSTALGNTQHFSREALADACLRNDLDEDDIAACLVSAWDIGDEGLAQRFCASIGAKTILQALPGRVSAEIAQKGLRKAADGRRHAKYKIHAQLGFLMFVLEHQPAGHLRNELDRLKVGLSRAT